MRLGTETGSVMNHIMTGTKQTDPEIGMGATLCSWTDRHPATVIYVDEFKSLVYVREDNYQRTDKNGWSESQEYEYTANPDGQVHAFRKNKHGRWERVRVNQKTGRFNKADCGYGLVLGRREKYWDPSF